MKGAKNMSEIQNAIEVKNLKKGFGGRVLFENFSLNYTPVIKRSSVVFPERFWKDNTATLDYRGIPAKCRDNQHCREICNAA